MREREWVPQTIAATFARIVADPRAAWLAVGDFLDDYRIPRWTEQGRAHLLSRYRDHAYGCGTSSHTSDHVLILV